MKNLLSGINRAFLFAFVSMYFGTGWSLVFFSFPVAPQLTVDNYYLQFVPQVTAATNFFTYMTMLMMISCGIIIIEEWKTTVKWYAIIILLLVILATMLTIAYIFPYNHAMEEGITDPVVLKEVLGKWLRLNVIRVSIWTLQWLTMAVYFVEIYVKVRKTASAH